MSYSFTLLTSSMSIGDSLSALNNNSLMFDDWLSNIQLSSSNYWAPFLNYYRDVYIDWGAKIDKAYISLDGWKKTSTHVEMTSGYWLEPITLVYPKVLPAGQLSKDIINEIHQWVRYKYPIIDYETINFVENQKLIVFFIQTVTNVKINNLKRTDTDNTTCTTIDYKHIVTCKKEFYGKVECGDNDFYCEQHPINVNSAFTVLCGFDDSQQQLKSYKQFIQANLTYNFTDSYETSPVPVYFKVENCNWVLINSI